MKKEKKYGLIVIILIIVLIVQLIYYRSNANKTKKALTDNNSKVENLSDKIIIENIDIALSDYYGKVTKEKLQESISLLALKTIEEIGNETREKTTQEIEKYYNENKAMISSKEIATKEDYVSIAEEINNFAPKGNLIFIKSRLQKSNENEEEDNEFYKLNLALEYDKGITLNLKCYLSNNNNVIEYLSNSQVEELYKIYKGSVTKKELYSTINEFKNNVKWIRENTKMVSINNQLRFYNDNQDKFKTMGINNSEDFINISTLMSNTVEWKNNTELNYYYIPLESFENNGDNSSVEIDYVYDFIEQLKLKIELTNGEKQQEKIRFTIF